MPEFNEYPQTETPQNPGPGSNMVTTVFEPIDTTHAPNAAAIKGQLDTKADSNTVPDMAAITDGDVPVYDASSGTFVPSGIKRIDSGMG